MAVLRWARVVWGSHLLSICFFVSFVNVLVHWDWAWERVGSAGLSERLGGLAAHVALAAVLAAPTTCEKGDAEVDSMERRMKGWERVAGVAAVSVMPWVAKTAVVCERPAQFFAENLMAAAVANGEDTVALGACLFRYLFEEDLRTSAVVLAALCVAVFLRNKVLSTWEMRNVTAIVVVLLRAMSEQGRDLRQRLLYVVLMAGGTLLVNLLVAKVAKSSPHRSVLVAIQKCWHESSFKSIESLEATLAALAREVSREKGKAVNVTVAFVLAFFVILVVSARSLVSEADPLLRALNTLHEAERKVKDLYQELLADPSHLNASSSTFESTRILEDDSAFPALTSAGRNSSYCFLKGLLLAKHGSALSALACLGCSLPPPFSMDGAAQATLDCMHAGKSTSLAEQLAIVQQKVQHVTEHAISEETVGSALRAVRRATETAAKSTEWAHTASKMCRKIQLDKELREGASIAGITGKMLDAIGMHQLSWWCTRKSVDELKAYAHDRFELAAMRVFSPSALTVQERKLAAEKQLVGYEDALAALELSTELDPLHQDGWFKLGVAREILGQQDAPVAYEMALKLDPEDYRTMYQTAAQHSLRKEFAKADNLLMRALMVLSLKRHDPLWCMLTRAELGRVRMSSGQLLPALEAMSSSAFLLGRALLACYDENHASPSLHSRRGIVYLNLEDPQAALKEFQAAVDRCQQLFEEGSPKYSSLESAESFSNLGTAYFELGDMLRAKSSFETALRVDPSHEGARRNLEILMEEATTMPFI